MSEPLPLNVLKILVVDDEANIRRTLAISLEAEGHSVVTVSNGRDALAEAATQSFDLTLLDLRLGTTSGADLIPELIARSPWMRIVIITAHGSIDSAVETMKRGASDYLTKPFTPTQVKLVVERVARMRALEQKVAGLEDGLGSRDTDAMLRTRDPAMQRVVSFAQQVAASDTTVLLRGESGTGKGVLAHAIHAWSYRASKPFGTVSCPALSPQLLESEMFGHTKGAFTGAVRDNLGRVASTDGGTLFLDEIGDLPITLQPKLLRFVQDREYERVGESRQRHADVRLITATNVDLEAASRDGRFREDLLYRIKVVQIDLPPLRERPEDVTDLANRFVAELGRARPIAGLTDQAHAALRNYAWPGNIRELRNVIERALILCQREQIGIEHLPANFASSKTAPDIELGDSVSLDQLEETHIRRVLVRSKSLDEAAGILGIDVATLWRRRKKYAI